MVIQGLGNRTNEAGARGPGQPGPARLLRALWRIVRS
jgi:hypothetical protein